MGGFNFPFMAPRNLPDSSIPFRQRQPRFPSNLPGSAIPFQQRQEHEPDFGIQEDWPTNLPGADVAFVQRQPQYPTNLPGSAIPFRQRRNRDVDPAKQPVDFENVQMNPKADSSSAVSEKALAEVSKPPPYAGKMLGKVPRGSMADLRSRDQLKRVLDAAYPSTRGGVWDQPPLTAPGGGDVGDYARKHGNRDLTKGVWDQARLEQHLGRRSQRGQAQAQEQTQVAQEKADQTFAEWNPFPEEPKPLGPGDATWEAVERERLLTEHQEDLDLIRSQGWSSAKVADEEAKVTDALNAALRIKFGQKTAGRSQEEEAALLNFRSTLSQEQEDREAAGEIDPEVIAAMEAFDQRQEGQLDAGLEALLRAFPRRNA